jgi:hypothetical protein
MAQHRRSFQPVRDIEAIRARMERPDEKLSLE